jgi:hypothetical protein
MGEVACASRYSPTIRLSLPRRAPGDRRAADAVARQQIACVGSLFGGLGDRLAALVPAAQLLSRGQERAKAAVQAPRAEGPSASQPDLRLAVVALAP